MRIFKWSPTFSTEQESAITPVWVCFSELPAHLFRKDALFAVASLIGVPLQLDENTYNQSRLTQARVCTEIDPIKPLISEIVLQIQGAEVIQKVTYEELPNYCSLCKHVGHKDEASYIHGNAPKPQLRRMNGNRRADLN